MWRRFEQINELHFYINENKLNQKMLQYPQNLTHTGRKAAAFKLSNIQTYNSAICFVVAIVQQCEMEAAFLIGWLTGER